MQSITAFFRFYEELNDFLPKEKKKILFPHQFSPSATVKDIIESLGVPHAEVDLILVNGKSVDFSFQLTEGDQVSIYPVFELFDISPLYKLRPEPLRKIRFILDVHLGKLARYLRLLGFDTRYDTQYPDNEIIAISKKENRIILTRDIGLLKNKQVTHGYWLRETDPKKQVREIIKKFDLIKKCKPFTRCLECNGEITSIDQSTIDRTTIPVRVKEIQSDFYQCVSCQRTYWQGTHYKKLMGLVEEWIGAMK